MEVRIAGIIPESLVNGIGMRRVIFAQGCKHHCKGCFNEHTHDFNGGEIVNCDDIVYDIKNNPLLKGVTFSGGDPFEQIEAFSYLAEEIHKLGLNVWSYTGYTFEEILGTDKEKLLKNIDVLVDGKFILELKSDKCKFRGSSNQRIIDVQESLKENKIVEFKLA